MAAFQEWFDDDQLDANTDVPQTRRQRFAAWLHEHVPAFVITNLLLILLLIYLWGHILIVIHAGQSGVLFRLFSGTDMDHVYGEGVHLISPLNTMTRYETRKQLLMHEFDVLTAKGLSVKLSLAIRYQPEVEMLPMLHQRIGPDYALRVITPQIESVMRKQLGRYVAEDIYTNKDGLLTRAILTALDEVGRNFVQVDDIIIRSIELPTTIKSSIEDKLSQEQMSQSYEFRQQIAEKEALRLKTEAEGLRSRNEILTKSLDDRILRREQIEALRDLAKSPNAKTLVMGGGAGADGKLLLNVTP
jgi:regulator of protease activity HflC (stomatin/prohibitin superfamily)